MGYVSSAKSGAGTHRVQGIGFGIGGRIISVSIWVGSFVAGCGSVEQWIPNCLNGEGSNLCKTSC